MITDKIFSFIPNKYYSRLASIVTTIYLILAILIYIYSVTCHGFMCGIGIAIPIFPAYMLVATLDNTLTSVDLEDIVFGSEISILIAVALHALLLYFTIYWITKFIKKIEK